MIEVELLPGSAPFYMIVRVPTLDDDMFDIYDDWVIAIKAMLKAELSVMSREDSIYSVRFELVQEEQNEWTLSLETVIVNHLQTEFLVLNGLFNSPESETSESFLDVGATVERVFAFLEHEWIRYL